MNWKYGKTKVKLKHLKIFCQEIWKFLGSLHQKTKKMLSMRRKIIIALKKVI